MLQIHIRDGIIDKNMQNYNKNIYEVENEFNGKISEICVIRYSVF